MEKQGSELARAVRGLRRLAEGGEAGVPSGFELVTRRGLEDLTRQVERLDAKLNGLLIAVAGAILIDLLRPG